jgi:hypothetical protein
VTYRQLELDRLGEVSPIPDDRLSWVSTYVFDKGRITRTDVYTPKGLLDIASIRLDFASFSRLLANSSLSVHLSGAITDFRVEGLDACDAKSIQDDPDYESDVGPMITRVVCAGGPRKANAPFMISWSITYQ